MNNLGKRSKLIPTRAGLVREVFYVCYLCPAELSEGEAAIHNCEEEVK